MRCKRPCPGCGKPDQHRAADGVCWDCSELLKEGLAARAQREKIARKRTGKKLFWIPENPHRFPYLRAGRDPEMDFHDGIEVRFQTAFHALCQIVGNEIARSSTVTSEASPVVLPESNESVSVIELEMDDETARHLATLYAMMTRNAEVCRNEGFEGGRNILIGLMNGTLSTVDAEKREEDRRA